MLKLIIGTCIFVLFCEGLDPKLRVQQQAEVTGSQRPSLRHSRRLQVINVIGNTGDPPPEALPLGECIGDCDQDSDVRSVLCFAPFA